MVSPLIAATVAGCPNLASLVESRQIHRMQGDPMTATDAWLSADGPSGASAKLFDAACRVIPGGVNSTPRATWSGWTPYPLFVESGQGSRLRDVDGNEYIDYLLGLGPMIFGHRPPRVTQAVVDFIQQRGTVFALPTADEARLAEKIIAAVPSVD